jgi:SAM-dependent methyltransferase
MARFAYMSTLISNAFKQITPPILFQSLKTLSKSFQSRNNSIIANSSLDEKSADWYDQSFLANEHWRLHYTQSRYYFFWTVIADRLSKAKVNSVLDIGCGPGQLACLLRDKGLKNYIGIDFSEKRIEWARLNCPEFRFVITDVFQTNIFEEYCYDAVICTEFLEHVERDIEVIRKVRTNTLFYATVPNFPFVSHVRHFNSEREVTDRYAQYFRHFYVDSFLASENGKQYYLLEGATL